jgi:paraquat-inducible protein A
MAHAPHGLLACPDCDLLQRIPEREPGKSVTVRCVRCQAVFWHESRGDHARALVLASAGLLLLVLANIFPLASLDLRGLQIETTLAGTAQALIDQDMYALAVLIVITLIVAPALQLAALCWLLLPGQSTRAGPGFKLACRLLPATRPWSMVEVFMLGALVSLVKIAEVATLTLGFGLVALAALMLVQSAAYAAFDPHELWEPGPSQ